MGDDPRTSVVDRDCRTISGHLNLVWCCTPLREAGAVIIVDGSRLNSVVFAEAGSISVASLFFWSIDTCADQHRDHRGVGYWLNRFERFLGAAREPHVAIFRGENRGHSMLDVVILDPQPVRRHRNDGAGASTFVRIRLRA
jgi:hypothetical protein